MKATEEEVNEHVRQICEQLGRTVCQIRADIRQVDEPQFRAMFETSAEVLCGILKAFHDYEHRSDGAWPE